MQEFDHSRRAVFSPGSSTSYFDGLTLNQFEPQRVDYSPRNAWWLAELSRVMYRLSTVENNMVLPDRVTILQNAGLRELAFFNDTGTQAAIISAPDKFDVLVFRGTDENADWLANGEFDFDPWPHGRGRVHAGFQRALERVWAPMEAELKKLRGPLFLAGHSLGGALAVLAGARLARDGVQRAVYIYGAPRAGNAEFVKHYPPNVTVHRIVNDEDVVTTVPPVFLGFRHVGQTRSITEDGQLVVGQPLSVVSLVRRVRTLVRRAREEEGVPLPGCLIDHAPVNYVAWLQRLAVSS